MVIPTIEQLLEARVHLGHLRSRWNPRMRPYIFMEKDKIHLIDVVKTQRLLEEAAKAVREIARQGRSILYVGTKKQAREIVREMAESVGMPYVTERWLGGMLTNYKTIRRSLMKMESIDRMIRDGTFEKISKKERLQKLREREKLERFLGGIARMQHFPPALLYVVDIVEEAIAVAEAQRLNIPIIAMVDTNADPTQVTFPIPSNDDSTRSIELITGTITAAIREGLEAARAESIAQEKAD
ncbi:MAG: 30S ribosomal protein S2 [Bacteroidia bacterium]|nr:30S ribosomal protein S2 [Bacteroidia bacterium]MDW8088212.1 30S ribosomal protein S2 [Bacteroidia bacterium]